MKDGVARIGFETRLIQRFSADVGHVHVLDADGAAVGLAQRVEISRRVARAGRPWKEPVLKLCERSASVNRSGTARARQSGRSVRFSGSRLAQRVPRSGRR